MLLETGFSFVETVGYAPNQRTQSNNTIVATMRAIKPRPEVMRVKKLDR